jgi:methionyl-tRNA formyltransferase
MRIVMFARVPAWYSFRQDRLARRLLADGHEIAAIVAENAGTFATMREWLHKLGPRVVLRKAAKRLLGRASAGAREGSGHSATAYPRCEAPVHRVASHNSDACLAILRGLRPEVLVLRGCGLIRAPVLQVPTLGTINPHYALLPAYRGMEVTEWSVLHGDPCAVNVHWVLDAVDAGGVIAGRLVEVERGDSLGKLREKCAALAAELLADALRRIEVEGIRPSPVPSTQGRQYFVMHPRLYQLAERRLKSA